MTPPPEAVRITGFVLRVRDPAQSTRFYCEGLGFEDDGREGADGVVSLAGVRVRLVAAGGGAPAPPPASADAPDFQHFAIRVREMDAACARVGDFDPQAISRQGPQRLPPADGSVTAWKFRDPDGHPLELLQVPGEDVPPGPLFAAIDHTAVACADVEASLAFYRRLGFSQGPSSHNHGAAQDRLDGLDGVDLAIATVHTRQAGPHIELLHYRRPIPPPRPARRGDAAFIATVLQTGSAGAAELADPDGHRFEFGPTAPPGR